MDIFKKELVSSESRAQFTAYSDPDPRFVRAFGGEFDEAQNCFVMLVAEFRSLLVLPVHCQCVLG